MKKIEKPPRMPESDINRIVGMLINGEKKELVERYNKEYYHWDELRYHCDDESVRDIWWLMKIARNMTKRRIEICGIDHFYSNLDSIQRLLHEIDRNTPNDMGLDANGNDMRYAISSLMEEAIASSQMEGAVVTRKDAKHMLMQKNPKPRTIDERMILNNYRAMEHIKSISDQKMIIGLLLEMHRTITKDTLAEGSQWEGRFREDNETVVGDPMDADIVFHVPPEYTKIPGMMAQLCSFINDDREYMHPVIKGIIIHYMIGYIHPFVNGNGRLARSLFYWYVIGRGYRWMEYTSISMIMKRSKTRYGLAYQYTETDDNDLTYFIRFHLDCIMESVKGLIAYVKRKNREFDGVVKTAEQNPELNMQELLIIRDYTRKGTVFTIGEISTRYGVSYQAARNYVNDLCDKGYVTVAGKQRKARLYLVDTSGHDDGSRGTNATQL